MLSQVLDTIPQSVFWKDLEGRYLGCNRRFAEECGFAEAAEVVGRTDFELHWPREEAEAYRADDLQVLNANAAKAHIVEPVQRADGARMWVDTSKVPLRDDRGEPFAVLGVYEDITQRLEAQRALAASEARYRSILATAMDGVWLLDARGRVLTCNEAAARMLGLEPGELPGRWLHEFEGAAPEEGAPPPPPLGSVMTQAGGLIETRLRRADGEALPVEISVAALDGEEARVAFVRDITPRKRLERERNAFEAQAHRAQKMESLGSLAGGVAHDINNVLGAILALASVHREEAPAGSDLRKDMDTILAACSRGGDLVKGLLGFAREGLAAEQEVDLNALVRDEVALLRHTTLQKVRLEIHLDPQLPPILGDPAALHHALMNLCVNAVDAMPAGGTLTLRTWTGSDGRVGLEVRDTGEGMSREVLAKALDPFFTTKPQGKGTGLGLAMVYRTVQGHRGELDLQSRPGEGTRVQLRFPPRVGGPGSPHPSPRPEAQAPARPLEVMLVDDDELILEAVPAMLESLGHRVRTAPGGAEALAQLASGPAPDVVVLDMNMPGMDGAAVLPELRRLLPEVPVLLATGRVDQGALDLVAAHGHVALLAKPFLRSELARALAASARP